MKVANRREAMLKAVLSGMTDVGALCEHFGMSEATVRRDLRALAEEHRIVRTYGGAAAPVGMHEPEESLETRRQSFREQKDAIARVAAAQVRDGDTIFLDGGTTTAAMARLLKSPSAMAQIAQFAALSVNPRYASGCAPGERPLHYFDRINQNNDRIGKP